MEEILSGRWPKPNACPMCGRCDETPEDSGGHAAKPEVLLYSLLLATLLGQFRPANDNGYSSVKTYPAQLPPLR